MNQRTNESLTTNALYVILIALTWVVLRKTTGSLFHFAEFVPGVNLIYLPALLKIIAIMMFGGVGAIGIALGSLLTLSHANIMQPLHITFIGLIVNISAPFAAVYIGSKLMQIPKSLVGLNHRHIIVLSFLSAFFSSIFHQIANQLTHVIHPMNDAAFQMFLGDFMGGMVMLYTLSIILRGIEFLRSR